MTTTRVEHLPGIWDDARDLTFFRITARIFTSEFCLGASVLLASDDTTGTAQPSRPEAHRPAPAREDDHDLPVRDLVPVQVRRTR